MASPGESGVNGLNLEFDEPDDQYYESCCSSPISERSGAGDSPPDSFSITLEDSLLGTSTGQSCTRKNSPENLSSPPVYERSGTENDQNDLSESLPSPPSSHSSDGGSIFTTTQPPDDDDDDGGDFAPDEVIFYLSLPRIFYPFTLCVPRPPTPQALTTYNPITGLRNTFFHTAHEASGKLFVDQQTMVVSCFVLGTDTMGVYFGPNSRHNFSLCLRDAPPHGRSRLAAEIFAVHKTLKIARRVANSFGPDHAVIMRIVVATCCEVVVNVVARWISELDRKRWGHADELCEGVADNRPRLTRLDRLVDDMVDEDGLEVLFWLVPPEEVVEAERLARGELGE